MRSGILLILLTLITFTGAKAQLPPPPGPDSIAIKLQLRQLRKEDSLKAHTYINRILTAGKDCSELVVNKEHVLRKDGRIRNSYRNIPPYVAYLFLFAFALLAIIVIIDRELLTQLFGCLLNPSQLIGLYNEGRFGFNLLNFAFDFIFVLSVTVIIQFVFFQYHPEYFIWIAIFTLAAYFVKVVFIQICAYLFFDRRVAISHSLFDLLFTRLLGLVLLPIVFCALYQSLFGMVFLMVILFVVTLCLYLIWLIMLLLKMKLDGVGGVFYLMLYLCAVEVFPLLIILKNFLI